MIGNNKFAKVGATSGGQLAVSCATAASYGTVRLCTSTQQKVGIVGWSAFTSNGELVILQPTNTGVAHPGVMSPSHWSKPTGSIALSTFFSGDTASLSAFAPSATTEAFGMMKAAKKTEEESDPTDALTLSCISSYNILQRVKDADGSYSATNLGNERDSSYTPGIYSTTEGINSIANSFGTTEDNAIGAHAEGF